ncbi:hypothetical protein TSUD_253880 [Trifolium subterraneum]|uniref:Uncharacterized protein n=1 Tax=Trifolium subterraneum TaxID=3900 RepID=A0A2Z6P9S7_TRISU|nr:hypothetical protein TSUD_253880 [Trifolium subterraneum]
MEAGKKECIVTNPWCDGASNWRVDKTMLRGSRKPTEIVAYVLDLVDEFNKANPKISINVGRNLEGKWEPPFVGELKMNVDADCFDDGKSCWGMLIRDHGQPLFARRT